ncbi:MAG TPA: transglycosylase SLT domain-containing protein [Thermomicrobiales bacterium]|nr:transglycosylase SLT domain-containing protein [Thermomicrobiales bacterium]
MLASFDQRPLLAVYRRFNDSSARRTPARVILALAIAGALLGGALAPAPPAALAARLATAADVALMAGPGATYGVLTTIPAGSSLKVAGDASDGFVPVTYNGVSGWVPAGVVDNGDGGGANANGNGDGDGGGNNGNGGGGGQGNGDAAPATGATDASSISSDAASGGDTSGAAPAAAPVNDGALVPPTDSQYSPDQIVGIITDAAHQYGQNPDDMVRVARCESGLNPNAVGGGQYYGLYQFVPSTFAGTPYGDQSIFDPSANAGAAAWMWSQGKKGQWTCQ